MNCAAARAAIRRGSNITIFLPLSHASSRKASGTWVVLPAPGGASSTRRGREASEARISGNNGVIGNIGTFMHTMIVGERKAAHRRHACLNERHAWPKDYCLSRDAAVFLCDPAADAG